METGLGAKRFRTTRWSDIVRARTSRADFEKLLKAYRGPVVAYLRRKGYQDADAEDLTQGFMVDVVMKRDLVGRADPNKGRFRTYLLTALDRFVIDTVVRRRPQPATLPDDRRADTEEPVSVFDREWAATVMTLTLRRVEAHCLKRGMNRQWRVFDARVVQVVRGADPVPVETLMAELGLESRTEVDSMVQTMKRKYQAALRAVVADTVDDDDDVEAELERLLEYLAV